MPGRGELARSFGRIRFHGSGKGSPSLEESVGHLKAAWARARRAALCIAAAGLRFALSSMVEETELSCRLFVESLERYGEDHIYYGSHAWYSMPTKLVKSCSPLL